VMKSLAKRVEDRYQSAAAMRSDIERYLAGRPVHATPPPPPPPLDDRTVVAAAPPVDPTSVRTPTVHDEDDERQGSRTGLIFLLGLLLVLLIAGAAYLLPQLFESPPEQDRVPDVIGLREAKARAELGAAGFDVAVDYRTDPSVKAGLVLEQDPNADQYVEPGTEVTIVVSEGRPLVEVPFVLNQQKGEARQTLEGQDFEVDLQERESDEPQGQVIETDPPPGTSVPQGSTVVVYYSDGPEEVPDVVDRQQEEAEQILGDAGFDVEVVEEANTTEPAGTVVRQSPEAGEEADQGDTVIIWVSTYEEPTETPSDSESPSPTLPTDTESPAGRPADDELFD
jgi:beta-lactam-binding protein with PASTA domain